MLSPMDPWSNLLLHSAPSEHTSPAACPQPSLCNVSPLPLILLDTGVGEQLIPFLHCVPPFSLLCRQTPPSSPNVSLQIVLPRGSVLHTLTRTRGPKSAPSALLTQTSTQTLREGALLLPSEHTLCPQQ